MKKVGIIGLGIIGEVWAKNYAAEGLLAATWNRTPKPDAPGWKDSVEAVAESSDVIQIVVADPPAVESIITRILPKLAGFPFEAVNFLNDFDGDQDVVFLKAQNGVGIVEKDVGVEDVIFHV